MSTGTGKSTTFELQKRLLSFYLDSSLSSMSIFIATYEPLRDILNFFWFQMTEEFLKKDTLGRLRDQAACT